MCAVLLVLLQCCLQARPPGLGAGTCSVRDQNPSGKPKGKASGECRNAVEGSSEVLVAVSAALVCCHAAVLPQGLLEPGLCHGTLCGARLARHPHRDARV